MADSMEEVTQRFRADVEDYLAEIQAAVDEARKFAAANEEAKVAVDGVRDHAAETAASLSRMKDEEHKAADAAGRFEWLSVMLGRVRDKAAEAAFAFNELKKEEREAADAGLLAKLGGLAGNIPMGGGLMSPAGILGIGGAVVALLPLVAGLVDGLAAAGAGAGAFAILAIPAIKSVSSAYQALNSAQQKYGAAVALENLDPSKAHARAVQAALDQLHLQQQALDKLPPAERNAVTGISQLTGEFSKISKAFAPEAFKVFSGVLHLANELLPTVTPFARTFADAVSGLLGKAGQFAGSSGFKDWLAQFHKLEGPAVTAIGDGIGKVAVAIGKLLTAMSAKDVVNALNITFSILSGTLNLVTGAIRNTMQHWDDLSKAAQRTWYDIKRWTDDVTQAFDRVRHFAATMAHDFANDFDTIRHDVAHWADDARHDVDLVTGWFEKLPGRILHAIEALPGELEHAGASAASMFVSGLKSIPVVGTVVGWAQDIWDHLPHSPAKKGPLSGAGSPDKSGFAIATLLAAGMRAGIGQVSAATRDMADAVKVAVRGGLITGTEGESLITWIAAGNARLKTLAAERQSIVDTINAERKYAASTASSIAGNYTLSGFATSGLNGGAATVGQIVSSLRLDVGQIRKWAHNIHKLAKEGLNRGYLGQLIALGPVQGAALVQELANAGLGDIKAINSAEYQISEASGQVGKLAASAMYDTSKNAAKGFLVGLLEQKKAITQLMEEVVRSMIAELKRELKLVKAPPQGAAGGLAGSGGYGGSPSVHVSIPVNVQGGAGTAYQSPEFMQYMQRIVQEAVLRYGQLNPGNGLTPAWGR